MEKIFRRTAQGASLGAVVGVVRPLDRFGKQRKKPRSVQFGYGLIGVFDL